jgi:hypothetical protein
MHRELYEETLKRSDPLGDENVEGRITSKLSKYIEYKYVDWIYLAQDIEQWLAPS